MTSMSSFVHRVDERRQEVQARLQHARLDADLAAHRDDAALRQRLAEVAPLDDADLLAADVRQHAAEHDEDEQHQHDDTGDDRDLDEHAGFLSAQRCKNA